MRSILSWNSVGGIAPCSTSVSSLTLGIITSKQRLNRFHIANRPCPPKSKLHRIGANKVFADDKVRPIQVGRKNYAVVTCDAAKYQRLSFYATLQRADRDRFKVFARLQNENSISGESHSLRRSSGARNRQARDGCPEVIKIFLFIGKGRRSRQAINIHRAAATIGGGHRVSQRSGYKR